MPAVVVGPYIIPTDLEIPLLRLPMELRDMIYSYIFQSDYLRDIANIIDGQSQETRLGILSTCRQIYHEASSIAWRFTMFNLCRPQSGKWINPQLKVNSLNELHSYAPILFRIRRISLRFDDLPDFLLPNVLPNLESVIFWTINFCYIYSVIRALTKLNPDLTTKCEKLKLIVILEQVPMWEPFAYGHRSCFSHRLKQYGGTVKLCYNSWWNIFPKHPRGGKQAVRAHDLTSQKETHCSK